MGNNFKGLSKDEIYLISRAEFENQKVITTAFVQKIFSDKNKASRVLVYLKKKGRILQIEKGKYLVVPIKAPNQRWNPHDFVVTSLWMGDTPYYIGYVSAYYYWKFTDQIPQVVFVLNTKKSIKKKKIGSLRFIAVRISPKKIYGLQKLNIEGETVFISDLERTLVDYLYFPMGSWDSVKDVIKSQIPKINIEKFIRYLNRFPVMSVRKRAGYILSKLGVSQKILMPLKKMIDKSNTYVNYNPFIKSRKGRVDSDWKVIINE